MTDEDRQVLVPLAEVVHELIRVLERTLPDRDARGAPTAAGSLLWLRMEAERVRDALCGIAPGPPPRPERLPPVQQGHTLLHGSPGQAP